MSECWVGVTLAIQVTAKALLVAYCWTPCISLMLWHVLALCGCGAKLRELCVGAEASCCRHCLVIFYVDPLSVPYVWLVPTWLLNLLAHIMHGNSSASFGGHLAAVVEFYRGEGHYPDRLQRLFEDAQACAQLWPELVNVRSIDGGGDDRDGTVPDFECDGRDWTCPGCNKMVFDSKAECPFCTGQIKRRGSRAGKDRTSSGQLGKPGRRAAGNRAQLRPAAPEAPPPPPAPPAPPSPSRSCWPPSPARQRRRSRSWSRSAPREVKVGEQR